jgi:2-polyprenyl-3-methyl-5-hydroxy-6-metoxy-1,4-benzoquinol methylase
MQQAVDYRAKARPEMHAFLPGAYASVLEVGCGAGLFSAALRQEATRWGIEPDTDAAAQAAGRLDRVLPGKYFDHASDLPATGFDLVVCNDVIEHMDDHEDFLASIRTKLRPGGVLVGSVPNVRHAPHLYRLLVARDWRYEDEGVLDRTHLRFFTQKSLARTLATHGFRVERIGGINPMRGAKGALATLIGVVTLGAHADIRYLQIAFRAART